MDGGHAGAPGRGWRPGGAVLVVVGAGVGPDRRGPGTALVVPAGSRALLLLPQWWARDVDRGAQLARERAARERQAERLATARDLHDVVAGHLSGIALQTEAALVAARAGGADTTVLAGVRTASVEALQQMRVLVDVRAHRRPGAPGGRARAHPGRGVELARAAGLQVRTDWPGDLAAGTDPRLPAGAPSPAPGRGGGPPRAHRGPHERPQARRGRPRDRPGELDRRPAAAARGLTPRPAAHGGPAGEGAGLRGVRERVAAVGGTVRAGADAADPALWRLEARLPASAPVSAVTVSPVGAPVSDGATVRVLLADDHTAVRAGLRAVLGTRRHPDGGTAVECRGGRRRRDRARPGPCPASRRRRHGPCGCPAPTASAATATVVAEGSQRCWC